MASREIKDLSLATQILYNRFYDRCRRDVELLREDIAILLTCTHREDRSKSKISRTPSEAFEIVMLKDGRVMPDIDTKVITHAEAVGLKYSDRCQFEGREG